MKGLKLVSILGIFLAIVALLGNTLTEKEMKQLEKDPQVLAALEERLVRYRQIRTKRCQEQVLEKANELVDSMLLEITRASKQDTLLRPAKPIKPETPEILQLPDSTAIQPLWEIDSLAKDSLPFSPEDSLQLLKQDTIN